MHIDARLSPKLQATQLHMHCITWHAMTHACTISLDQVSKLQKRVLARAGLQGPEAVQQLMAAVRVGERLHGVSGALTSTAQVGKSSRFVVTDSHIKLASS